MTDPNLAKEKQREARLRRIYGIGIEEYNSLLSKQNGCCAICERPESEFKTRLAVDHNHATGEIRGLCCNHCNRRIVGRHRDGALLRRLADYVEQGTGWYVPKRRRTVKRKKKNA